MIQFFKMKRKIKHTLQVNNNFQLKYDLVLVHLNFHHEFFLRYLRTYLYFHQYSLYDVLKYSIVSG